SSSAAPGSSSHSHARPWTTVCRASWIVPGRRSPHGGRATDRAKTPPAEPDRWEEQPTGNLYCGIYQALPASERGAWLKSRGFLIHATKKQVSVIQGDVRGTAHLG